MKKLAGINEGTAFKNGKFTLDRFDVWTTSFGDIADELSPDGEWCNSDDVKKLEELAAELLAVVQMTIATSAPNNLGGIAKKARDVIKKAKSL